jgi:alginate O-acetyltransferase complex protein AlgJ
VSAALPALGGPRSGMLLRWRRYLTIPAFLLLAIPLIVGIVRPDGPAAFLKEARTVAPAPQIPRSNAAWPALPRQIDAYLRDHFGLRDTLIRAHKDLTKPMLGIVGTDSVLVGRNGHLFYLGDDTVRQSAGVLFRDERVSETVALLARMNAALTARGIKFLVAVPPNAPTIYGDDLPRWAQNHGRRIEYDLMLDELAAKGVKAIDLRPAEREARSHGAAFFMHDTHWTPRGALAAFNTIVETDEHPNWRLDPKSALSELKSHNGGDLARMLGVEGLTERAEDLTLPSVQEVLLSAKPFRDYVATSNKPGPTIMLFGDSFTAALFDRMLLPHAARVIWLEHNRCGFDWTAIDRFYPDEVWWMPNERFLICNLGAEPAGFAAEDAAQEPATLSFRNTERGR